MDAETKRAINDINKRIDELEDIIHQKADLQAYEQSLVDEKEGRLIPLNDL